jgi:hypothetical protein
MIVCLDKTWMIVCATATTAITTTTTTAIAK